MNFIPIARPSVGMDEIQGIIDVVKSGMIAGGATVKEFEQRIAEYIGVKHAIAVSSGTAALHTAYSALKFGPGDEIITTPFTFAATIDMIKATGAIPVFVDIKDDFNIDENLIEKAITNKTKAIVPVHLFGKPCNMEVIMKIAKKHKLKVVEDAAQAIGAEFHGKKVGSFGDVNIFSFYATKALACGEGGMCLTNDDKLAEFMRLFRNHGMNGLNYDYSMIGYNYNMTNIEAAIGLAQLNKIEHFIKVRQSIAFNYSFFLKQFVHPQQDENTRHIFANYSILVKNREKVMEVLKANGIDAKIYYPKPFTDLPNATRISKEIMAIPIRPNLTSDEVNHIISILSEEKQ